MYICLMSVLTDTYMLAILNFKKMYAKIKGLLIYFVTELLPGVRPEQREV